MSTQTLRNRFGFGIGTIGRDAAYTLVSMFLLFYLSDILQVSGEVFATVSIVIVAGRILDAVIDPFVGVLVDNTRSRWGKFKPWIVVGVLLSAGLTVMMFTPWDLGEVAFILVFSVVYIAWSAAFAANDISYWSMLPALTQDQREREKIGSFARICASIGTFSVVVAIVPVSSAIGEATGDIRSSFFWVALVISIAMVVFQTVMVLLTREDHHAAVHSHTRFRDLAQVIFRNDQLLAIAVSFVIFMTAFAVTTGFGTYYFKYVYGDVDMYGVFAAVLGVSQITALALYPVIAARTTRRTLFTIALFVVLGGYGLFFLTPPGGLALVVIAGVAVFAAQAIIQIQLLMFVADTVEYGEHKFGRRNDSVTLSLQPVIYKGSSALSSAVISATVIASGVLDAEDHTQMTDSGTTLIKLMMFIIPGALIAVSYLIYRRWYTLTEVRYAEIVEELHARRAAEKEEHAAG